MSGSAGNKRSKRDDGTAKRNLGQETAAATAAAAAGGSGASEQAKPDKQLQWADVQENLKANTFACQALGAIANQLREKRFRDSMKSKPLKTGSRVCVQVWGTVYGKTEEGANVVVVDGTAESGVLVVPEKSELVSGQKARVTHLKWSEMYKNASAVKKAIEEVVEEVLESTDEN